MMKKLSITLLTAFAAAVAFAPATQAALLYEEHFVDSDTNPAWQTSFPGLAVAGVQVNSSVSGWMSAGGGDYGAIVSNLWADTSPTPDGDGWHFFGFLDSGNGNLYTKDATVTIASADRLQTTFSADLAKRVDDGLRWRAKVGGTVYFSDVFFTSDSGAVTSEGSVSEWKNESIDVETADWYDESDLGTALSLPAGDITQLGFLVLKNDNGDRVAVDNFQVNNIPEPTSLSLLALGGLALLRRRRRA